MKHGALFFLGTSTLTVALAAASGIAGCQGGSSGTGASGTTTETGGSGGGTTTGSNTNSTTGTTGGTGGGGTTTAATEVTIRQITDPAAPGHVGKGIKIKVKGLVAMSRKFLVSQSSKGSCLWGVMVSESNLTTTAPYTGIMAVSYGTDAMIDPGGTEAFCPTIELGEPAGDAFPDDVKPGDVFDIDGQADSFIPGFCGQPDDAGTVNAKESTIAQYQISRIEPGGAVKTGTAPVPTPALIDDTALAKIASQTDEAYYAQWGGVKVRVQNVAPLLVGTPGAVVGQFGKITLMGSNVEVGDKLYYHGLLNKQKVVCHMTPAYMDSTTTFTQIDGFVFLNRCTWGLEPANRCVDLQPPSDNCAGNLCP